MWSFVARRCAGPQRVKKLDHRGGSLKKMDEPVGRPRPATNRWKGRQKSTLTTE